MLPLAHIVEPVALLLTWQSADESASDRLRRVVGRVEPSTGGGAVFKYFDNSEDFERARATGFQGFPAFKLGREQYAEGVLEAFLRRLPPRTREDFGRYLAQHRLPSPFPYSDLALLGYTGAKLPADGFSLVPVFPECLAAPLELIIEVAGVRHAFDGDASSIREGDKVDFRREPTNKIEADAIEVRWRGQRLGYVNRALRHQFCAWLETAAVFGSVERINGKPTRPVVFIRVRVEPESSLRTGSRRDQEGLTT